MAGHCRNRAECNDQAAPSCRIADIELLRKELFVWETERNIIAAKLAVDWHFRTGDARIKLKSLSLSFTAAS